MQGGLKMNPQKDTADTVESKVKSKKLKDFGNSATFLLLASCMTGGTHGLESMRRLKKPKQYTFDDSHQAAINRAEEKRKRKADRKMLEDGRRRNGIKRDGDTNAGQNIMEESEGKGDGGLRA
jgi:hypothetical protein